MFTIIGGDQKEYGPVSAEDLRKWIAEGRLNAQTLAKAESDAEFRPLAAFPEFAGNFASAVPESEVPPVQSFDPNWESVVRERQPELRLGECLATGWSFLAANFGFMVGAVFLTWVANLVLVLFSLFIPLVGALVLLCLNGVIMGGFYLAVLRRMRGETVMPSAVFAGFSGLFVQLLLAGLVSMLLTEIGFCFCVLPMIYLAVAWIFILPLVADKKMFFWSAMELSRKVVTRVWFEMLALTLIAFLPMVIFQIFNLFQTGSFFLNLYDESNRDWQQLAHLIQSRHEEIRTMTLKMTAIGQGVLLLNLFYFAGVLMRAYENLFGTRKP
jgi:hypothetical protein